MIRTVPRRRGGPTGSLVAAVRKALRSVGANAREVRTSLPTALPRDHFDGRRFRNSEPSSRILARDVASLVWNLAKRRGGGTPPLQVPVQSPEIPLLPADLAVTWLGHATVLLEIDGHRILTDPVFGDRASPADFLGPRRLHPVPVTALPRLDAVLISHDHYDHLDRTTMIELAAQSTAALVVPLGIGAHLRAWGVPAHRITELDWGDERRIGALTIRCTPARHFSGRGLVRNTTLWASWAIAGPSHRAFFGGDTGYMTQFAEIGRQYGNFDLTMLPIGAYDRAWPDVHLTPEQAAQAHRDLRGAVLLPIHWATFNLAPHPWSEPIERLLRTRQAASVITPEPGQYVTVARTATGDPWWRGSQPR